MAFAALWLSWVWSQLHCAKQRCQPLERFQDMLLGKKIRVGHQGVVRHGASPSETVQFAANWDSCATNETEPNAFVLGLVQHPGQPAN
jgi:hypothetical protein